MARDVRVASGSDQQLGLSGSGTDLPQALLVCLAGALVSGYVGLAGIHLGLETGRWLAAVAVLVVACPSVWLLSSTLRSSGPGEPRHEILRRTAFPCLAALPLAALWPEFVFGDPSRARIGAVLVLTGSLFCLLWMLGSRRGLRAALAWAESRSTAIALTIVSVHAALFGAAVVLRHVMFGCDHGADTAYYTQILWSTVHGEFFRGSVTQDRYFDPPVSTEFTLHNSPILLAVLPVYGLYPSFYTLLVLRSVLLSAGGIPLFLLAKEKIGGLAGVVVLLAYFASANIFYQALNGFYPLQLITFFLPVSFLYFYRERFWPFVLWLLLALTVREEVALTTALFGVYALLLRRSARWILTPIALSVVWWYVSTEFVMVQSRITMEELEQFYQAFGGGHNSALAAVLADPGKVLEPLVAKDNLGYLYQLLRPTAGFPLLSAASLFMLPTVLVNSIIGDFMPSMRNVSYHYSVVAAVCAFVALIDGVSRVARHAGWLAMRQPVLGLGLALLLMPGTVLGAVDVVRYGGGRGESLVNDFLPKPQRGALERILALVPPDASVAAPHILMPHLSHRRGLYSSDRLWRYGVREIDYVILDARPDRLSDADRNRAKYESVVARMRRDGGYDLIFSADGLEVYKRQTAPGRGPSGSGSGAGDAVGMGGIGLGDAKYLVS